MAVQFIQWIENEMDEGAIGFGVGLLSGESVCFFIEIYVAPQSVSKRLDIKSPYRKLLKEAMTWLGVWGIP